MVLLLLIVRIVMRSQRRDRAPTPPRRRRSVPTIPPMLLVGVTWVLIGGVGISVFATQIAALPAPSITLHAGWDTTVPVLLGQSIVGGVLCGAMWAGPRLHRAWQALGRRSVQRIDRIVLWYYQRTSGHQR